MAQTGEMLRDCGLGESHHFRKATDRHLALGD
jgi:hypothetical protein